MSDKIFFLHIMKTGGTTLAGFLGRHFHQSEIFTLQSGQRFHEVPQSELERFKLFWGHFDFADLGRFTWQPQGITLLRDPVERLVSDYENLRRSSVTHRLACLAKSLPLQEFVTLNEKTVGMAIINRQTHQVAFSAHAPTLSADAALEKAVHNLETFEFVGLTEELPRTIEMLCELFGWYPPDNLPALRVRHPGARQGALNESTAQRIRELNQLDIQLYEFARKRFYEQYDQMAARLRRRYGAASGGRANGQDTIRRLVEKHYIQQFSSRHPPPDCELRLSFEQAIDGDGWHPRDGGPPDHPHFWRWSGPGTFSFLDLPLAGDRDSTLAVRVMNTISPEVQKSLHFSVNGEALPHREVRDDKPGIIYCVDVPARVLALSPGRARFGFHVSHTETMAYIDPASQTSVGIAVTEVNAAPAKREYESVHSESDMKDMTFPKQDRFWTSAADFVRSHVKDGEQVIAPPEFEEIIEHPVHSIPSGASLRGFNWAVIHKGRIEERSGTALKQIRKDWRPVFANEVFVIFSKGGAIPAIDRNSPHLRSFDEKLRRRMLRQLRKWSGAFAHGVRQRVVASIHALRRDTPSPPQADSTRMTAYLGDHRLITRTVWGHKILLDTRDLSLTPHLIMGGYWEMWITKVFMDTVKSGMSVLEVGANVGYYTLLAADAVGPSGRVYCFEANPRLQDNLFGTLSVNGYLDRVRLIKKAAYDRSGKIKFHVLKKHHGSSSVYNFDPDFLEQFNDEVEVVEVEAVTIDEELPTENVDIIKLDAEGSEPRIFKGMKKLLERSGKIVIFCEFAPAFFSGSGDDPKAFLEEIQNLGFQLNRIDESSQVVPMEIDQLMLLDLCELYLRR